MRIVQQRPLRMVALSALLFLRLPDAASQLPTNAREILSQASRLIPEIPEPQQMSVASNIANAQARAGDLEGALSTACQLKNPWAQGTAMGSVAHFVDYSGDLDSALQIIGTATNAHARNTSYEVISGAHALKGDFAGALRVAHLIQNDRNGLIAALNEIAAEQWRSGAHADAQENWGKALHLAKQRGKDDPSVEFFLSGIATSHAQAGDTEGAFEILDQMRAMIEKRDHPDEGLLSILATNFAQMGEISEALEIIKTVPPGTNRDITLQIISTQLSNKDDIADAEQTAYRISDSKIKALTLRGIALSEADSGRPASAIAMTDKIAGSPARAAALALLALEQAKKGDDAASETLRLASAAATQDAANTPPYVFSQIAVTHAMLGDFDTAEEMTRRIPSDDRSWPLESIAGMLVNSGDLNRAFKLAEAEKEAYPKSCALLGIANALLVQAARTSEKRDQSSALNLK